jgi:hypothetical protein
LLQAIVDRVLSFHNSRHLMNEVVDDPRLLDDESPLGQKTEYQSPRQLTIATFVEPQPPLRQEPREFMLRSTTLAQGEYAVEGGDTTARFVWPRPHLERPEEGAATLQASDVATSGGLGTGGGLQEAGCTWDAVMAHEETGANQPRIIREEQESTEAQPPVETVDDPQLVIRNFVRLSHDLNSASATSDTDDLLTAVAQKLEPVAALSLAAPATEEDGDVIDNEPLKVMSQRTSTAPIVPTNSVNLNVEEPRVHS